MLVFFGFLEIIGFVILLMFAVTIVNEIVKLRGDSEFLVEVISKEYAKKVADKLVEAGYVEKKIEMTEEDAARLGRELVRGK